MAKNKLKLEIVKYNALKLRRTYQLPYQLVYYITQLNELDNVEWVTYLMSMTEHLLRVKGYYKKYPQAEQEANTQLKHDYFTKFKDIRA